MSVTIYEPDDYVSPSYIAIGHHGHGDLWIMWNDGTVSIEKDRDADHGYMRDQKASEDSIAWGRLADNGMMSVLIWNYRKMDILERRRLVRRAVYLVTRALRAPEEVHVYA